MLTIYYVSIKKFVRDVFTGPRSIFAFEIRITIVLNYVFVRKLYIS